MRSHHCTNNHAGNFDTPILASAIRWIEENLKEMYFEQQASVVYAGLVASEAGIRVIQG